MVPLSSQINYSGQNLQVYPIITKENRSIHHESQLNHPNTSIQHNIYYNPNGIVVNPI